jgi:hypothetical protein
LEVAAACAFHIVAYMVAVFFGGEPRDSEFAAVDAQPRNVHGFRRCGICDLNDLLKVFVRLRLARAHVLAAKVAVRCAIYRRRLAGVVVNIETLVQQRVREHGDQSYLHHRQTRRCRGMSIGKYSMPDC